MERRIGNIIIQSAGGTAGKNANTYKAVLPTAWIKKMGITEENRQVALCFDGEMITISKRTDLQEFIQAGRRMNHRIICLRYYAGDRLCSLIAADYEALAETAASMLLEHSNIERDTPFRFTRYRMERILVHGRERTGCSSETFLHDGESIVTLSRLFRQYLGGSLSDALERLSSDKKRMAYLADATAELTELREFPQYLTLLFEIDALVLNDDRHLNNIAVLEKNGKFDYCPIFDQGAGFLSNVMYAPMDIVPKFLIAQTRARPFHTTFNRQIKTMQAMYGKHLELPRFTRSELSEMLEPLLQYYPERDRRLIADRVCETILVRQKQM